MREIKFRTWTGKKMHYGNSSIADKTDWPLMQFTGLKDREGKDIWEGDICRNFWVEKYGKAPIYEVIFEKGAFGFKAKNGDRINRKHHSLEITKIDNWEVLGNIYQNPELMKP